MRLRVGHPRAALIVAPHPDDETIGAYGLMRELHRRGTRLRVIVVSDGGASHPASVRWPRERLVRERRRETVRALRGIGMARAAVIFLGFPDGALPAVSARCRQRLASAVRRTAGLDLLIGPADRDDHADHRAVAMMVKAIRLPGVRRLSYLVWPIAARLPGAAALALGQQERMAKRRTILRYRTQAGGITDDPAGFHMTPRQVAAFSRPRELFREEAR